MHIFCYLLASFIAIRSYSIYIYVAKFETAFLLLLVTGLSLTTLSSSSVASRQAELITLDACVIHACTLPLRQKNSPGGLG